MKYLGLALLCFGLAACAQEENRVAFEGQYYRASAKKNKADPTFFEIDVRPVSASLEGAREAGRYEATIYCVQNYGTSQIDWQIGPDQEDGTYTITNDTLNLQGRCIE